ncbi:MAG: hypothetical protein JJV98_21920 [Desulfosarcina sp.]|nr:hypothetical protein [Desulfobacterales bacterium]
MEKGKRLLKGTGIVAALVAVLISGAVVWAIERSSGGDAERRADIIAIDTMKAFGRLQRPTVVYRHDQHTEVLMKQGKDCSVCHLKDEKNRMSPKYKRLKEVDANSTMLVYHDNCIACHTETLASGEKGGPVTCGGCHAAKPTAVSDWKAIELDKSLHFRHTKKLKDQCKLCHHEYNQETKKLVYVEGQEGACVYCHREQAEENRISQQDASHAACISCHRETRDKKAEAGPINCSGCHDPDKQLEIAVVEDVPRMKRNQPDMVFVKTGVKSALTPEGAVRAKAVPFNHKAHEGYNNTCIVCHHASLTACAECHTVNGAKEGDFIQLNQAMHQIGSDPSCIGCHNRAQEDKSCAGCHTFIRKGIKQDTASCRACHMEAAPSGAEITGKPEESAMAAMLLTSRVPVRGTYADADIPEKVTINKLEKKFRPVEMPHRKIVQALVKGIGDNPMAANFHADPGTLCQGCHHNSPPSKKPPQCASCHGKPFVENKPHTPGLLGAYHIQCMGCHAEMGIGKPVGCTECHKEK